MQNLNSNGATGCPAGALSAMPASNAAPKQRRPDGAMATGFASYSCEQHTKEQQRARRLELCPL